MRTPILLGICLVAAVALGSTWIAAKPLHRQGIVTKPTVTTSKPLTINECLGLGGDTANTQGCKTGLKCVTKTVDQKGVVTEHVQCITVLQ